jgi:hypothetical protein
MRRAALAGGQPATDNSTASYETVVTGCSRLHFINRSAASWAQKSNSPPLISPLPQP